MRAACSAGVSPGSAHQQHGGAKPAGAPPCQRHRLSTGAGAAAAKQRTGVRAQAAATVSSPVMPGPHWRHARTPLPNHPFPNLSSMPQQHKRRLPAWHPLPAGLGARDEQPDARHAEPHGGGRAAARTHVLAARPESERRRLCRQQRADAAGGCVGGVGRRRRRPAARLRPADDCRREPGGQPHSRVVRPASKLRLLLQDASRAGRGWLLKPRAPPAAAPGPACLPACLPACGAPPVDKPLLVAWPARLGRLTAPASAPLLQYWERRPVAVFARIMQASALLHLCTLYAWAVR